MKKKKAEIFLWIWGAMISWFVAYTILQDVEKEISEYGYLEGRVSEFGICEYPTTAYFMGIPIRTESENLCLMIDTHPKLFRLFKTSRDYSSYLTQLKQGDQIVIHYKDDLSKKDFASVVQLQNEQQVIYSKLDWDNQQLFVFGSLVVVGFVFLTVGYIRHKKSSVANTAK